MNLPSSTKFLFALLIISISIPNASLAGIGEKATTNVQNGVGTGASLAAGAIAGAVLTEAAVVATTGVITSAGTLADAVTAVETASAGMAAIFLALPLP